MILTQAFYDWFGDAYGPLNYIAGDADFLSPLGYSPIDIRVTGMAGYYNDLGAGDFAQLQNYVNTVPVGDSLLLQPFATNRVVSFSTPFVVPGVTGANVNGAARWGLKAGNAVLGGEGTVTWVYEPVNPADAGKQIMGIGGGLHLTGSFFLDAHTADSYVLAYETAIPGTLANQSYTRIFSPITRRGGLGLNHDAPTASFTRYFVCWAETQADQQPVMDNYRWKIPGDSPAAITWFTPGIFGDFKLVARFPPTGDHIIAFRRNQQTLFTLTAWATAQQLFFASTGAATTVTARPGDIFSLECTHSTAAFEGALLWTFKRDETVDPTSGYGELGYGEQYG